MIQGSLEWLNFRRNKIGASDAAVIMHVSPWKKLITLWEEKIGLKEEKSNTYHMKRGINLEPLARLYFNAMTGFRVEPDVCISFHYPWMMASLDGYDPKTNVVLEIKCPGKEDQALAVQGKIPEKYYPQLQHQMAVMEVDYMYYLSFNGIEGPILKVKRDQSYIEQMIEKEQIFYDCVANFVVPLEK
jgi:putative phage-type endonuclease